MQTNSKKSIDKELMKITTLIILKAYLQADILILSEKKFTNEINFTSK